MINSSIYSFIIAKTTTKSDPTLELITKIFGSYVIIIIIIALLIIIRIAHYFALFRIRKEIIEIKEIMEDVFYEEDSPKKEKHNKKEEIDNI